MGKTRPLRLGSRGSALARWQVEDVSRRLRALGQVCEIEIIRTAGDQGPRGNPGAAGLKGLFTRELEEALLDGRIDAAVHSLKDVPSRLPEGMVLAAIPHRADARDALVAEPGMTLLRLPPSSRVGTGSLRRQAQIRVLRTDLEVVPMRGNVDSRLERWRAGEFDAIVLAVAGLTRLGFEDVIAEAISPLQMCPAAGQGALALECRADDGATREMLGDLHHAPSGLAVEAERAVLARLECDCDAPVAAWAELHAGALYLEALVAAPDGAEVVRAGYGADHGESPRQLGERTAETLLERGAADILARLRTDSGRP